MIALASNASLSLSNAGENHGLAVVVTVSTHTQGNLSGVLISLEHLVQTQNGIWGSLSDLRQLCHRTAHPTFAQREAAKERRRVGLRALAVSTQLLHSKEAGTSKHGEELKEIMRSGKKWGNGEREKEDPNAVQRLHLGGKG